MAKNSSIDLITYGEILWDIIDGIPHLGGAPFNLAAHASLCGLKTAVISALGNDKLGEQALARAEELEIDTRWILTDAEKPTGTVVVKVAGSVPHYTIKESVAWDNIMLSDAAIAEIAAAAPAVFCFGSLAQRSRASAQSLIKLLNALTECLVFFDVNLRQNFWSPAIIAASLTKTNWLKVNDDEALLLNRELFRASSGLASFADSIFRDFAVDGVIITCGAEGCMVFERGHEPVKARGVKVEVADTVGAGDAFSAAFLAALLQGRSAAQAAAIGNHRGAMVASKPGAIPAI